MKKNKERNKERKEKKKKEERTLYFRLLILSKPQMIVKGKTSRVIFVYLSLHSRCVFTAFL